LRFFVWWLKKATVYKTQLYSSQPSRLQTSRDVYKTGVTSAIHRHVYKSHVMFTIITVL